MLITTAARVLIATVARVLIATVGRVLIVDTTTLAPKTDRRAEQPPPMLISILSALAAGGCFAAAGVLQQRVASTRPDDEALSYRLIIDLVQQPMWLVGIGVAVLSYVFQALALAFGPLATVQPLIITELIFAVPVSAGLQHARLGVREWAGIIAVAGGLAVAILAADPRGGDPLPDFTKWLVTLPVGAVVVGAALLVGGKVHGTARAGLFALAAAVTLGTQAALLQSTTEVFRGGIGHGLSSWQPYLMAVTAIGGLLLVQSAYQAGPLAASLPVIDAVEPAVAVVIGVAIFDEHIRVTAVSMTLTALGVIALITGILVLDTSPLVHRLLVRESEPDGAPGAASSDGILGSDRPATGAGSDGEPVHDRTAHDRAG